MSHLLIPGPATADSAVMWAAAIDEPDSPADLDAGATRGARQVLATWDYELPGAAKDVGMSTETTSAAPPSPV